MSAQFFVYLRYDQSTRVVNIDCCCKIRPFKDKCLLHDPSVVVCGKVCDVVWCVVFRACCVGCIGREPCSLQFVAYLHHRGTSLIRNSPPPRILQ